VTTGAHEIAGLEGTLHIILEKLTGALCLKERTGAAAWRAAKQTGPLWESQP
jgi:hypothetical protein